MKTIDQGLVPLRAVRRAISREFGHQASRYAAHLHTTQARYARQVTAYRRSRKPKLVEPAAAI